MGGPNVADNKVTLCANGHYMAHAYIALLIKYGEDIDVVLKRHFGPSVRQLARRGWAAAGEPRKGVPAE
jgi:hypothetical protein